MYNSAFCIKGIQCYIRCSNRIVCSATLTSCIDSLSDQCIQIQFALPDLITALNHRLDAKWKYFGILLGVEYRVLEAIQRDKSGNPEDCMLDLVGKWTCEQEGMGTVPRTWQTVVEAVQQSGDRVLAQDIASKYGVHLAP